MSRQVRLDDDVSAMVEARQATEGGSLTENANRMLRELAQDRNPPIVVTRSVPAVSVVLPARRRAARRSRVPTVTPATIAAGCLHPLLHRRGDGCGACGATLAGYARPPASP